MPSRILVASLVLCCTGLAQAQAETQSGWHGTIVSDYTTTEEGERPLSPPSAGGGILTGSGGFRAVRRTQTTYTLEDTRTTASHQLRSSRESHGVLHGLMACTLADVAAHRARSIESTNWTSEMETGQASGPAECTFETFAGGVHIHCSSPATGESHHTVSKREGCSNCCGSAPDEHTEKNPPAESSSSEIDLPPVDVEARFEGPDIPLTLVGSKSSESSDRKTRGTVSWVLSHKVEYEVEVVPEGYETWRPKGGANELLRGNALRVNATLKRKNGKPLEVTARKFVFTLVRRSSEPGVMMNWPPHDEIKPDEPDLRFDEDLNKPLKLKIGGDRGSEASTPDGKYQAASASISSYDWGAYGELTVEAVLGDGTRVLGHLPQEPSKTTILIPKRSGPDDPIAEIWRRRHQVMGLDARDDSDPSPVGDGHPGDGLTLYEEYRGFRVDGHHLSTDPAKKDLFVVNEIGIKAAERGILLFSKATGIAVHVIRFEELDQWGINRNSSGIFQNQLQHGVLVDNSPKKSEVSQGDFPKVPGLTLYVTMTGVLMQKNYGAEYERTVVHELGHTCQVHHHGEADIGPAKWEMGKDGRIWEYRRWYDAEKYSGAGTPIVVFRDGAPVSPSEEGLPARRWHVGSPHGQHSGAEDCAMRYDCADSAQVYRQPDARYRTFREEKGGLTFCSSSQGTGVNAPGDSFDHPRYGDAAPNRGNCLAKLCVNDARIGEHGSD